MKIKSKITILIIILIGIISLDLYINKMEVFKSFFSIIEIEEGEEAQKLYNENHNINTEIVFSKTEEYNIKDENEIVIDISNADIQIEQSEDEKLKMKYKIKKVKNNKINESDLKIVKALVFSRDKKINIELYENHIENLYWEITLFLPKNMIINFQGENNKIDIKKMNNDINMEIANSSCKIEEVLGKIDVDTKYGYLEILDAQKRVDIKSDYSTIRLENIKSELNLVFNYSDCTMEKINGDINLISKFSDVLLEDIYSEINAEIEYGKFEYEDIEKNLFLKSKMAKIEIELKKNDSEYTFNIENQKGKIWVNERVDTSEIKKGDIILDLNINQGILEIN